MALSLSRFLCKQGIVIVVVVCLFVVQGEPQQQRHSEASRAVQAGGPARGGRCHEEGQGGHHGHQRHSGAHWQEVKVQVRGGEQRERF